MRSWIAESIVSCTSRPGRIVRSSRREIGLAQSVVDHAALAVTTVQRSVQRVLDTRQPLAVHAHEAQQLGGQLSLRVHAPAGGRQVQSLHLHRAHRTGLARRQLAAQVDEAATAVGQRGGQRGHVALQQRGQALGQPARVADQAWVGAHVVGRLGHRQLHSAAIADGAAGRRQSQHPCLLCVGDAAERVPAHRAEVGGARCGQSQAGQEQDQQEGDPALDQAHRALAAVRGWFRERWLSGPTRRTWARRRSGLPPGPAQGQAQEWRRRRRRGRRRRRRDGLRRAAAGALAATGARAGCAGAGVTTATGRGHGLEALGQGAPGPVSVRAGRGSHVGHRPGRRHHHSQLGGARPAPARKLTGARPGRAAHRCGAPGRAALDGAADAGVELEQRDLHGHEPDQQEADHHDPALAPHQAVDQWAVGQRAGPRGPRRTASGAPVSLRRS